MDISRKELFICQIVLMNHQRDDLKAVGHFEEVLIIQIILDLASPFLCNGRGGVENCVTDQFQLRFGVVVY